MKTYIIKIFSLIIFVVCFGRVNAQNDLFAVNTASVPGNVADLFKSDNKIVIGDFKKMTESETNVPIVTVKSESSITMQIRVFTLNGDLAKEEARTLENGMNDLKVDMSDLSQGVYMVQFYSKEGSALRRFIKNN